MLHDGYFEKVYYRFWETKSAKANLFAIHGLGGHCLWFDNAANLLNQNNINLFSFDLPGFGQSKYPKGTIESYKDWINITKDILERFLNDFNITKPVFILGHSLGALIAMILTKKVKANGWILSVPGFEGHYKTWPLFNFIIPVIFKSIVKPNENIFLPFGPELLTQNKETELKVKQDPLRVINVKANIYLQVYLLTLASKNSFKYLDQPVLMLIAGKDMVCSTAVMEDFFNKIKSKNKCKKIYTNSFHDLFIEDELNQIVDDIVQWIDQRDNPEGKLEN
ncbi:MAG: alpha/beta fold hydrolase [Candidatus Melainabacteria bacterium]|nr:alpha/beta fold hydrolase [Candidatus Melainabacteria bacterium]